MKLELLRKVIREEVKNAIKEELQEMLTEAVIAASNPMTENKSQKRNPMISTAPAPIRKVNSLDPIAQLLQETKATMSPDEYSNVYKGDTSTAQNFQRPNHATQMVNELGMSTGTQIGLDLSQFNFIEKAKLVNKAIIEKDKAKGKL